jgi:hypothetical protein
VRLTAQVRVDPTRGYTRGMIQPEGVWDGTVADPTGSEGGTE